MAEQKPSKSSPYIDDWLEVFERRNVAKEDGPSLFFPPPGRAVFKDNELILATDSEVQKTHGDGSQMCHRFRISTPSEDRMGDIIVPRGCQKYLTRYEKNAVVFFNHKSYDLPIGSSTDPVTKQLRLELTDDYIDAACYYHGKTLESCQVYELVEEGYLRGASIGFRPVRGRFLDDNVDTSKMDREEIRFCGPGILFEEWELLEWSIVGVPCNQEAARSILSKNFAGKPLSDTLKRRLPLPEQEKSNTVTVEGEVPAGTSPSTAEEEEKFLKDLQEGVLTLNQSREARDLTDEIELKEVPDPDPVDIGTFDRKKWREKFLTHPHLVIKELIKELGLGDQQFSIRADGIEHDGKISQNSLFLTLDSPHFKLDGNDLLPPPYQPKEDEPEPEPEPAPKPMKRPPGVKCLDYLLHEFTEVCETLQRKMLDVEHPKTKPFLEQKCGELQKCYQEVLKFAMKVYPEHFSEGEGDKSSEVTEKSQEIPTEPSQVPPPPPPKLPDPPELVRLRTQLERIAQADETIRQQYYRLTGRKLS